MPSNSKIFPEIAKAYYERFSKKIAPFLNNRFIDIITLLTAPTSLIVIYLLEGTDHSWIPCNCGCFKGKSSDLLSSKSEYGIAAGIVINTLVIFAVLHLFVFDTFDIYPVEVGILIGLGTLALLVFFDAIFYDLTIKDNDSDENQKIRLLQLKKINASLPSAADPTKETNLIEHHAVEQYDERPKENECIAVHENEEKSVKSHSNYKSVKSHNKSNAQSSNLQQNTDDEKEEKGYSNKLEMELANVRDDISGFKQEVNRKIADQNKDISGFKQEVTEKMAHQKAEITKSFDELKSNVDSRMNAVEVELKNYKQMVEKEMRKMQNDIADNAEEIDGLEQDIDDIKESIDDVQSDILNIESRLKRSESLSEQIEQLKQAIKAKSDDPLMGDKVKAVLNWNRWYDSVVWQYFDIDSVDDYEDKLRNFYEGMFVVHFVLLCLCLGSSVAYIVDVQQSDVRLTSWADIYEFVVILLAGNVAGFTVINQISLWFLQYYPSSAEETKISDVQPGFSERTPLLTSVQ